MSELRSAGRQSNRQRSTNLEISQTQYKSSYVYQDNASMTVKTIAEEACLRMT